MVFISKNFLTFFDGNLKTYGSFESQIAAICDDIAYNNNDIDDGLYANFFDIEELEQLNIVKKALKSIKIIKNAKASIYEKTSRIRDLNKTTNQRPMKIWVA